MVNKLRMGMVGGGSGAFIGNIHRMAAAMDSQIDLVCGAFSSDPGRSLASGIQLGLSPERSYPSFADMFRQEKKLPPSKRMHFVSIVTPNHLHFEPARLALENGFDVICDKPLTFNLKEAEKLQRTAEKTGRLFAVTYTYSGYPMVKQARELVRQNHLGHVRKVMVEYCQGWLSTPLESSGNKQASWRTDPGKSGMAGAIGDIGTHAAHLAEYVSGLRIVELCADLSRFVAGRQLDDDGNVLLRFHTGAKGLLTATQIAAGEENALSLRIYGERGGLEWCQQEPNTLVVKWLDKPAEHLRTGAGSLFPQAQAHARFPAGHPEGYLEAFANIYRNFAHCLKARLENRQPDPLLADFPTLEEGVRGMRFIERVVKSAEGDKKWLKF